MLDEHANVSKKYSKSSFLSFPCFVSPSPVSPPTDSESTTISTNSRHTPSFVRNGDNKNAPALTTQKPNNQTRV